MMKIQLGRWTIRTANSLRKKIEDGLSKGATENMYYWQCVGIYDTRICGIVFYRNGEYDFKPKQQKPLTNDNPTSTNN